MRQRQVLEGGEPVKEGRELASEVVVVEDELVELCESLKAPGYGSVEALAADEFEHLEGWKEAKRQGEGTLKKIVASGTM